MISGFFHYQSRIQPMALLDLFYLFIQKHSPNLLPFQFHLPPRRNLKMNVTLFRYLFHVPARVKRCLAINVPCSHPELLINYFISDCHPQFII